jgi:serine/threonine protein kinase
MTLKKPVVTIVSNKTPKVPGRIGRFLIEREIGRGMIGAVYVGHDPVMDRDVAIKTFNPTLSPQARREHDQHFINEARAAGRLSHPNIVTIFEASSEAPDNYLAMEWLQGRELGSMLAEGHVFSLDDVASIIWKLSDALDYAHKQQVVHRDIKPSNIFLVGDHQPKLVDFGIARAPNRASEQLSTDDAPFTLFRNNLLGTPNYMSPEQATGRAVDHRTDIYSLGAVMFEMLTGARPFQSRDTDKLLHMIAYKAPSKPHELNAAIPIALSRIVMKAMGKQVENRYQQAGEMTADLKRYLVDGKRARRNLKITMNDVARNDGQAGPRLRPALLGAITLVGAAVLLVLSHWRTG